ncbi:MAG: glycine--tRNA ligase subunit beta [Sphingobium sp.]|nr:MAG: glycine--tRNA ligase subunit beta [Sphingobium sp.]
MTDFLLELRSEEIPARMQAKAKDDLVRLFTEALAKAGLAAETVEAFATPRRLALIAKGLPLETQAVSEETKGPKVGAPPQAMEGFLRKTGLNEDQLVERDGVYFAVVEKPGRKTADVLAEAIPAIIRAFPWPKSQRWGAASASTESLRWVRPLQGIIALLGDDVVACEIDGIVNGRETMGHRFHSTGPVEIANAAAYVEALRAAHVIVHYSERTAIIRDGAAAAAKAAGLTLVEDEGLVAENAGLTEWPVPMLGRFDPAFLEVPQEVIQLTARVNQKYFVCHDKSGKLANAFVCTANIVANDGGAAIVAGNEKVLAARLSDAKFFWEQDLKIPLDEQAKKLSQITFHEKLGTVSDKVERVAQLARWLVEQAIVNGASADDAERAARLCKADLVTGMVGEFPELQGLMGGYYARAQGEADAVADAVRDHYKPVGQGDDVPTAPVTVAVSLADKLDTLVGFFQIDEKPTGSKDPFALRRAAIGILSLILENDLRVSMRDLITAAAHAGGSNAGLDIANFLIDRLKVQQRDAGIRHDMIDAVVAVANGGDNVLMVKRVKALQGFVGTDEGANLLAGYKRAANILKQADVAPAQAGAAGGATQTAQDKPTAAPASAGATELALLSALDSAEPKAVAAIEAEQFEDAMAALASLRAPIDAFFDGVMVNDPDPEKRAFRLGLLARFRDAVSQVADFSKIEG